MAEQKGLFRVRGTLGGVSFYSSKDGDLAREKGGVSKDKIAKDPAFARTRENGMEFGTAGTTGKMLRDLLRPYMMNASDSRVSSRLTKTMMQLVKLDGTSDRGKRHPSLGLSTDAGKALLQGFNFNIDSKMGSILYKPYTIDDQAGSISFGTLSTMNDIVYPEGATHVKIGYILACLDFATGKGDVDASISEFLEIKVQAPAVNFTLVSPKPTGEGVKLNLLKIEFAQQLNGKFYSLKNDSFNALEVLAVA